LRRPTEKNIEGKKATRVGGGGGGQNLATERQKKSEEQIFASALIMITMSSMDPLKVFIFNDTDCMFNR
jgi:hypothetical protein